MKTTKTLNFAPHFIFLSVLFILGNSVIGLPYRNANKYTFLGFLLSFIVLNVFCFIIFYLNFSRPLLLFPFILSFWAGADAFLELLEFISQTLLRNTPKILILLPLVFAVLVFAAASDLMLFKFSVLLGLFSVTAVIFFAFFTAKDFNADNIIIKSLPSGNVILTQTIPYIKSVTLPSLLLCFYAKITKASKKSAFGGLFCGNLLLAVCILNSVLLFGSDFAGKLKYPYASAISTVTLGNLFTRMDGFAYLIFFASVIVKITVCVKIIAFCIIKERRFKG